MPRDLPIFPLPLVLFPGAVQPLHIFEPRYCELLADCLAGDKRFGIAYAAPQPGGGDPAPEPGDVGCIAVVRSTHPLPDGRSNVLTMGERRFVLLEWCASERSYRVGRVEEFDDEPVDLSEAMTLAADVRERFTRLAAALGLLTDREHEHVELPTDPQGLSFQVAAALELEPKAKRALLEIRSTAVRLRRLAALLGPLATDAERRAVVRRRAKGNGQGGPRPQIERAP